MAVKTINAKITEATTDNGVAIIVVEFDDGKGKWTKRYKQSNELIDLAKFQEIVAADIRKDLKVKDQLAEVKPVISQTFSFTV